MIAPSSVYLDHNATSPLTPATRSRWHALIEAQLGNPGSVHRSGQEARAALERARRRVASALGSRSGDVVFCSGATEANNLAILGCTRAGHLVVPVIEHASVLGPARQSGRAVRWIACDSTGRIDVDALERALDGACLVSVSAANNELGNALDLAHLAACCARAGVALHVDAAQVAGRWVWSVPAGVTSVTLSAHKAGGPVGVGALWLASSALAPAPLLHGGHQERGRRAGTENPMLAELLAETVSAPHVGWGRVQSVRDALESALIERLGAVPVGDRAMRLPNTAALAFAGREAEEIVQALDLAGVAISAGSACTAGSVERSHVVAALGLPEELARSVVRVSLGWPDAEIDVAAVVDRFVRALGSRRGLGGR